MKPGDAQPELPKDAGEATISRLDKLRFSTGSQSTAQIRGKMQRVMQARNAAPGLSRSPSSCFNRPAFCRRSASSAFVQLGHQFSDVTARRIRSVKQQC